jgi:hypothetical protein
MMTGLGILERALFTVFVVATDALVAINVGWVFLAVSWNSILLGIVPILSFATLASFLAFVLLEDHLGSRRCGVDGSQP